MAIPVKSDLSLPRKPTQADHAASKGYVDDTLGALTTSLGTAAYINTGTTSGTVPVLDTNGKLATSTIPAKAITERFPVANQAAMLALTGSDIGDLAVWTDGRIFVQVNEPASSLSSWVEWIISNYTVSVNGQDGVVLLGAVDVGAIPLTQKGVANGVATLDAGVKVPYAQLPAQHTVPTSAPAVTTWDPNGKLYASTPLSTDPATTVANKGYVDTAVLDAVTGENFPISTHNDVIAGDGSQTAFTITHGLGSQSLMVQVWQQLSGGPEEIHVEKKLTTSNTALITFALPPSSTETFIVKCMKF